MCVVVQRVQFNARTRSALYNRDFIEHAAGQKRAVSRSRILLTITIIDIVRRASTLELE